jgi:aconitate hydratase
VSDNSFGSLRGLAVGTRTYSVFALSAVDRPGVERLPYSLKILLENLLRTEDGVSVTPEDIETLATWDPGTEPHHEIAFSPARILMQDFTGVPAVVDLAAMRDGVEALGGDPARVNPRVPTELVIDHSVIVDHYGTRSAFDVNAQLEFERNRERYRFLRWGQQAFEGLRVVPPDTGICHQVNLEYLARVVFSTDEGLAYPDTLVGTDSHTPMVNGLGVLGWGVGGIEAEAAMLGQAITMLIPRVVGFKLHGELPDGTTATDLVLTIAEQLRQHGVVGTFVEFYGPGVANVPLENRATIGNMSPEYGSTVTIFPIDDETLRYLRFTGRSEERVALVEAYAKAQGLWHDPGLEPAFSARIELDLSTIEPSLAGPTRPHDRLGLHDAQRVQRAALSRLLSARQSDATPRKVEAAPVFSQGRHELIAGGLDEASAESFPASDPPAASGPTARVKRPRPPGPEAMGPAISAPHQVTLTGGTTCEVDHSHVVIAAITSCTNTSNPAVMIAAGLLAKKAVERGLTVKPWVKTSLAPGSRVVMDYYARAGLVPYLEALGYHLVGFGCTTCIGNSGPIDPGLSALADRLALVSVLSGNRNFEGRINPDVRMNYLTSPPLVVAYALAGTMDTDLTRDPLGTDHDGAPVYLGDIWPSPKEVQETIRDAVRSEMFTDAYGSVFTGDDRWNGLEVASGPRFQWDDNSTYVHRPPFFDGIDRDPAALVDIIEARCLAKLGPSVTTDHISPAGSIGRDTPAGRWLIDHGVRPEDFNSYGSRRGNHEVMIRGTFANIRLRNQLAPGTEGGWTRHQPSGDEMTIYDAAVRYAGERVPLIILAGTEYGSGSSRDWAAKGTLLLGVRAVLAESFERIHRSNLIGMGVLPVQFADGDTADSLGLTGTESYSINGLAGISTSESMPTEVTIRAAKADGVTVDFTAKVRVDTPKEADYYRHGGILQYVLRQLAVSAGQPAMLVEDSGAGVVDVASGGDALLAGEAPEMRDGL